MSTAQPLNALDPLLDRAPCGFLSFGEDGRVVLVNATLLEMLGYAREDVAGQHLESILSVGTRIFYQTHLFPLARIHGRAEEIFLLLRAKDGTDVGVFANIARRASDGAALYDMTVMRVRERQKYEEELLNARRTADEARRIVEEQAVELEATAEELQSANDDLVAQAEELHRLRNMADSANRAKTDFLAVMSHELRTPLNAISGYLQILQMGIHGTLSEKQQETIGRIDRAQRHLLRLINDLLNLSKLEAGAVDYLIDDVRVGEVLADVALLVEPQVAHKRLLLEYDVEPDLLVRADHDKLEQIVLNLLGNAVKFTPDAGRIVLRGARSTTAPDMVEIQVVDSGIGIPEDRLEKIFEPFVQVENAQTRHTIGTGLGLAISRDLARGMGGDIVATSRLGAGSSFTVTLPGG